MADEEDIVQRIRVEGESELLQVFKGIAAAGKQAFTDVSAAATSVGNAFSEVVKDARAASQAINSGAQNADESLKKVEQSSRRFGESIRNAARTASTALGNIGRAINVEPIATGIRRVVTTVNGMRGAFTSVFTGIQNGVRAVEAALGRNIGRIFSANLTQIKNAAQSLGTTLRTVGSAIGTFVGRVALIGGGAAVAVAAFRSMARAATGAAAAERVASRERLADIRDEKGDVTGLQNIRNQANEALIKINNEYGRGKLTLEQYNEALVEQQEAQAAATRQFMLSDSQEAQARKRQFEAMRKLRESEAFDSIADKVGNQAAGAFVRLGTVIDQVASKAKTILSPAIANIVTGITNAIQNNQPIIIKFFEDIRSKLGNIDIGKIIAENLPGAIDALKGAAGAALVLYNILTGFISVLDSVAAGFNKIFGTNISGGFLAGGLALLYFSGIMSAAIPILALFGKAILGLVPLIFRLVPALIALGVSMGPIGLIIAALVIGIGLFLVLSGKLEAALTKLGKVFAAFQKDGIKGAVAEWNRVPTAAEEAARKSNDAFGKVLDGLPGIANKSATAAGDQFKGISTKANTEAVKTSDAFKKELDKLPASTAAAASQAGTEFGKLTQSVSAVGPQLANAANSFNQAWANIAQGAQNAAGQARTAWDGLVVYFETQIPIRITTLATTMWGSIVTSATTASQQVLALWQGVFTTLQTSTTGLSATWWQPIIDSATAAVTTITQTWQGLVSFLNSFPSLIVLDGAVWQQFKNGAEESAQAINTAFQNILGPVKNVFEQIAQAAEQAWARVPQGLRDIIGMAQGGVVNFGTGYASGGAVRGRGTGTSDSILARLSNGEFVQRTAAVRHYGVDFMNALNQLRIPKDLLGYAAGGLVGMMPSLAPAPVMRFADGGAVDGPRNALTLVLDGETFGGMLAPDDVFENLKKKAIKKSLSPRKPNWF